MYLSTCLTDTRAYVVQFPVRWVWMSGTRGWDAHDHRGYLYFLGLVNLTPLHHLYHLLLVPNDIPTQLSLEHNFVGLSVRINRAYK